MGRIIATRYDLIWLGLIWSSRGDVSSVVSCRVFVSYRYNSLASGRGSWVVTPCVVGGPWVGSCVVGRGLVGWWVGG